MITIEDKRIALKAIVLSQMIDECRTQVASDLSSWPEHKEVVRLLNDAATIVCTRAFRTINEEHAR